MKFGYTIVYVSSVKETLAFYKEAFGFETRFLNSGAIFKFLTKPWEGDLLRKHIQDAFEFHEAKHNDLGIFNP